MEHDENSPPCETDPAARTQISAALGECDGEALIDPARERVRVEDLPASWSLLETMVWLALRDAADVRDASPETAREATLYFTEDGSRGLVPTAGNRGFTGLRLTVEWVSRKLVNEATIGPSPKQSQSDLLQALRAGKIIARGEPEPGSGLRPMLPDDWRGLTLIERGNALLAVPDGIIGRAWHDVRLDRDEIVCRWPPLGDPSEPKIPAGHPPKPVPAHKRRKGGHQTTKQVTAAIQALGAKLAAQGAPSPGDGGQAELERWFIEFVEGRQGEVSPGRARVHVRRAIALHVKAMEC